MNPVDARKKLQATIYATSPEAFSLLQIAIELKDGNATRVIFLDSEQWACTCGEPDCPHIMATQALVYDVFQGSAKLTLAMIAAQIPFDPLQLAELADVNLIVVTSMLRDQPVTRWQAEQVLTALSAMQQRDYNLNTVKVALLENSALPEPPRVEYPQQV